MIGSTAQALLEEESAPLRVPASILELRSGIDHVDRALVELLAERCRLARELGETKRRSGLPMMDPPREAEVVRRAGVAAREGDLDEELVRQLFWGVIELARRCQRPAV